MLETLTQSQIFSYQELGYIVLERHLPMNVMDSIRLEINRFEEEARGLNASNDRLELVRRGTAQSIRASGV